MTKRQRLISIIALLLFFIVVLGVVVGMSMKNSADLQTIIEESVHSQLISICVAAREIIDVDAIVSYNDASVAALPAYQETLAQLRSLCKSVDAEYIYIVHGVETVEQASAIAQHLLDNFKTKELDRYVEKYNVGLSIGVALFPYHSSNYNVLIKYADIAMYEAKQGGKNQFFIYEEGLDAKN